MSTRIFASALAASLITMVPVAAGAPAHAAVPPALTCHYTFSAWPGGFTAHLAMANTGPAIDGWTARWTFDTPTLATSTWAARLDQANLMEAVATPASWNRVIQTGGVVTFGWTAQAASTEVPTDITVNGIPC